jgi:DNA-binding NarL/FixJ family response regulator
MRIRILLADSHPAFLTTLSRFLCAQKDIEVVGQASTGPAAVELTRQSNPNIVLMDVDTAVPPSMDVVRRIHREQPGVKIIFWSIDPLPPRVCEALQTAVSGYLLKGCDPETLLTAIQAVAAGGRYMSPDVNCRPQDARQAP